MESKKGEGSTFYFTLPAGIEYKEYGNFDLPALSISHFLQLLEVADYFQIIAVGAGVEFIP